MKLTLVLFLSVFALALGCTDHVAETSADAQTDVSVDTTITPDVIDSLLVALVLENGGDAPVFVQLSDGGGPAWRRLFQAGDVLKVDAGCDCLCDAEVCALCGMGLGVVQRLELGEELSFTWSGVHYTPRTVDSGVCFDTVAPAAGPYEVELCWGYSTRVEGLDEWVVDPQCDTVAFVLGTDGEARLVTPPRTDTHFEGLGWYTESFEHEGFDVGADSISNTPGRCEFRSPTPSTWWLGGGWELLDGREFDGGPWQVGLMHVTGEVSEEGNYGHMGGYSKEIVVTSAELMVCETAEVFRACVTPEVGDLCVTAPGLEGNTAFRPEYRTVNFIEDASDPDGWTYYEVALFYDDPNGDDDEFTIFFGFHFPIGVNGSVPISELRDPILKIQHSPPGAPVIGFDSLEGMVTREADRITVSVQGMEFLPETPHELFLWGGFARPVP